MRLKMYEYFVTIKTDTNFLGVCYKLDYKLDSIENMIKFTEKMKEEGHKNPVILFFKWLNE